MNDLSEVPQQQAVATRANPDDFLTLAISRGADIPTIERLWELKVRVEERAAKQEFVAAMSKFKAEKIDIYKSKRVAFEEKDSKKVVEYFHARLSDVTDALVPAMAKYGLSHNWIVRQENGLVHVDCVLTHYLGHSEKVSMFCAPDSSGKKNPVQQIASAVSYLQRYTLLAITGFATKDMDDDGKDTGEPEDEPPPYADEPIRRPEPRKQQEPERAPPREETPPPRREEPRSEPERQRTPMGGTKASPGQVKTIRNRLAGRDEATWIKKYGIASLEEITVDDGNDLLKRLREASSS